MRFVKISYQGGGAHNVRPEHIVCISYDAGASPRPPRPDKNGVVTFHLTTGKELSVNGCSKNDYEEYLSDWNDALEGIPSEITEPILLNT